MDRFRKNGARAWLRIGLVAFYSFGLLLALRFGARTYPGWYFPNSRFLNGLLNASTLFTGVGYDLVLIAAAAAAARIWFRGTLKQRPLGALVLMQGAALAAVFAIIIYGIWWAALMHRLPWQAS